uniref:Uncharacterized protein n=1 Tax=Oryza meridionalis TaxID=40149 RepID=A0A0E0CFF3_9ORYZ
MASTASLNAKPHQCQYLFLEVSYITAHSYASYAAVATVCQDELNHLAALGGDDAIRYYIHILMYDTVDFLSNV